MSGSEQERTTKSRAEEQSLRVAVAISLLRSKLLQKQQKQPPPHPVDQSDSLRWKRKAKERKQELLRLRQDLNEAEDASQCDLFPQSASCKCYFFDNLGKLSPNKRLPDPSQCRFNDVLRRRFLRHVVFEEWVASMVHARKALQVLESRNGVYVLYMERVIGELARHVGLNMSLHKLKREILDSLLFHH